VSRLRVSAISYLNTAPLMWDFDYGDLRRGYRVDYTLPSACAELLRTGMADIGIIPVAAYATIPELVVIPDVAIAARGAVRSIFLIAKVPAQQLQRVAVDTSSRTSVALLRVLLERRWKSHPEFVPMAPDQKSMLKECDAALLIGDAALQAKREGFQVYDLAEEWQQLTGKNFVFAFWAARKQAISTFDEIALKKITRDFQLSRDHGLEAANLVRLVSEWEKRIALSKEIIRDYLTEAIYYKLDQPCLEGLKLFYRYAHECGALPEAPELFFLPA